MLYLRSFSFAFFNPYANAGAGVIHTEDAPAIATDAVATLSRKPRRVLTISIPFLSSANETDDFVEAYLAI